MDRNDKYLSDLMQELPQVKAPEGLTTLIMQKIKPKKEVVFTPSKPTWYSQAFLLMLLVFVSEVGLLIYLGQHFSWNTFMDRFQDVLQSGYEYLALNNYNTPLLITLIIGLGLYLFVKERLDYVRYHKVAC